ncbi:IS66 family insertion sequence element accessory protein TnpA, partial [Thiolapillus sp.]
MAGSRHRLAGLTQKAYCEQQELRYSTFGY